MTLKEAHTSWSQQEDIKAFATKTRWIFDRLFKTLYDEPCEKLTKDILREAISKAMLGFSDKVKGASVVVHVLKFAGVKPGFEYSDLTKDKTVTISQHTEHSEQKRNISERKFLRPDGSKRPKAERLKMERKEPILEQKFPETTQELLRPDGSKRPKAERPKTDQKFPKINNDMKQDVDRLGRSRNRAPRPVAQIDMSTLEVIKIWPKKGAAEKELGIWNIDRAILKGRPAGGFYWCDEQDIDTFNPADDMRGRGAKANATARPLPARKKEEPIKKETAKVKKTKADASKTVAEKGPDATPAEQELPLLMDRGHITSTQGKTSPTLEQKITLDGFTDKELALELQRRGWTGEIKVKEGIVTITINL